MGVVFQFDQMPGVENNIFAGVKLYQIGEICIDYGGTTGPHKQWCYEISYIVSGEGISYENECGRPVQTNDVCLNSNSGIHELSGTRNSRLRFMYLGFDVVEDASNSLAGIVEYFKDCPNLCFKDRCGIGGVMRELVQEFYSERQGFSEVVSALLRILLIYVYRNIQMMHGVDYIKKTNSSNAVVTMITNYIDSNLRNLKQVSQVADDLGYNASYLSNMFHEKTGETLIGYIRRKKMEAARRMLELQNTNVDQVADYFCYSSVQSFSKAYKSVCGETPSETKMKAKER